MEVRDGCHSCDLPHISAARRAKKPKSGAAPLPASQPAGLAAIPEAAEAADEADPQQQPDADMEQQEQEQQAVGEEQAAAAEAAAMSPAAAADADVAEYELGEGGCEGTPTTPLGEEDEATAALQVGQGMGWLPRKGWTAANTGNKPARHPLAAPACPRSHRVQAQVQQLIGDLQRAEERCVLLEAEVREEVADEMAQVGRGGCWGGGGRGGGGERKGRPVGGFG